MTSARLLCLLVVRIPELQVYSTPTNKACLYVGGDGAYHSVAYKGPLGVKPLKNLGV